MVSPTKYPNTRIPIFLASLVLKGIAGALFFGSVDLVNSAINSLALLAGRQVHLPYPPTINAFMWFGGILSTLLPIPLPLTLKLVPILFDSLLAVLVYDLVHRREPRLAFRAGLLYALSPLALLITSFHGQWDAIALFFLLLAFGVLEDGTGDSRELLFGALFGMSLLIKPIALPFLLLFPLPKRSRRLSGGPAILGLTIVLGTACAVFWSYGYSIGETMIKVVAYSAKGVPTFGLPFAPLVAGLHLRGYRLPIVLVAMIVLAVLHHRRRLTAMDAILLFYLYCVATAGISPQYLLWPAPLLMATRRLRLAAFYTAVATAFLLLYYSNPWASYFPFENLGVFAPLRNLSWLLAPAALEKRELLPLVHVLGNLVIPACALIVGAFVIKSRVPMDYEPTRASEPLWHWYAVPLCVVCTAILIAKLTVNTSQAHFRLTQIWNALPGAYGLRLQSLDSHIVLGRDAAGGAGPDIVVLLAGFTALWCVFAARDIHLATTDSTWAAIHEYVFSNPNRSR
jgi:hypothetical protein